MNRLLGRQGSVITQALDHGNTVDETDEAVLRMGLPMAPSVLLQLVGPKVANHVRHTLHEAWPDRYPLSATLESLAEGGEPVVVEHAPRSVDELHTAVLEALADESRHILEEGVVAEAADIDTCLLLGAGFPFWLGGITKHLDQTGVSERIVGRPLAELAAHGVVALPRTRARTLRYAPPGTARRSSARAINSSEGAARKDVLPECTRLRPSRR